jgi:hypothetical protein
MLIKRIEQLFARLVIYLPSLSACQNPELSTPFCRDHVTQFHAAVMA